MRIPISAILGGIIGIAVVATAWGGFYSVDEGERAVLTRNGAVIGEAGPGLHMKLPFFDNAHIISIRDQVANYPNLEAYTRDQQTATVSNISVNYRIDPGAVLDIYKRYGTVENLLNQMITRRMGKTLEEVFGQYNAERAVQERAKLGIDFATAIKNVTGPIEITGVQVENFSFPSEYETNINNRMAAEVEALKAVQNAKKTVTDAQAAADAKIADAKAQAEAVRLAGEAEAAAVRAKGDALRQNPELVQLILAERWDGVLPVTMVPGAAVPFIDVK